VRTGADTLVFYHCSLIKRTVYFMVMWFHEAPSALSWDSHNAYFIIVGKSASFLCEAALLTLKIQ
jgi:hypothetical protein